MRCICCDRNLNDSESTRRLVSTGDFLDMCNKCYKDVENDVPTTVRQDLVPTEQIEETEEFYYLDEPSEWDNS